MGYVQLGGSAELTHVAAIIWQLDLDRKNQMLVVTHVDWATHSIGSLILKGRGSFGAASRVTSRTALPGTTLVLAMKVPCHRKLLRPEKIGMVGHRSNNKEREWKLQGF